MTRFLWVWAAFAPLFVLWSIRGNPPLEAFLGTWTWVSACLALAVLPNLAVVSAVFSAARSRALPGEETPAEVEATGEHLVAFLLAMLLPLYDANVAAARDAAALASAVVLVMCVFWMAELHVLNLVLAGAGYRVSLVRWKQGPGDHHPASDQRVFLLTRDRQAPLPGQAVRVHSVLNTVFVEAD